jgi:hypothetical protein
MWLTLRSAVEEEYAIGVYLICARKVNPDDLRMQKK